MRSMRCAAVAILGLACTPVFTSADTLWSNVVFRTTGQNMWGEGSAFVFNAPDKFLGFDHSVSWELDGIRDWSGFHNYVGVSLYADANWKAGINVGASLSSGSVDVLYPVAVNLEIPATITEGELFTIGSSFAVQDGASMNTVFPYINPRAQAILQLGAKLALEGCWYDDCDTWTIFKAGVSYQQDLLALLTDLPTHPGESTTFELPDNWATIQVTIPNDLDTTGSLVGQNLVSSTGSRAGEFVDARLNLLKLGELIPGDVGAAFAAFNYAEEGEWYIHPFTFHARVDWNTIDLDAGAIARIEQDFTFVPDLTIDLLTSSGDTFASFKAGESIDLVAPEGVGDSFELTPVFTLGNSFTNSTGLQVDPVFDIRVLEFGYAATVHEIGFHAEDTFGPLYQNEWIASGFDIPLYSHTFSLDIPAVTGESFTMRFDGEPVPEPVPEPESLVLFGTGLAMLLAGVLRRRRGAARSATPTRTQ